MEPDLSIEILGLKLKNPLILASGILGISGSLLKRMAEVGAGAVTTKSTGPSSREGFKGPVVVEVEDGLLNSLGLPNPGVSEMVKELDEAKKGKVPVIFSIYGFDINEYCKAAKIASDAGVDAIELNISCPHVKEVSVEIGQDPKLVSEIVKSVKETVDKPVIVKLSPNVSDIVSIAKVVEESGADAVTAINTVKAMSIDIDIKKPVLSNRIGGLSGPAIKPIGLRCVYEIFEKVKIPIIGCGGVSRWSDVIEYMLAGASAVQIGTALVNEDTAIFEKMKKGIKKYMLDKNIGEISSIVGLAHTK
ncbi:MAG: dihydroorotate dehydrogenase [Candidatus Bathyarchaeota archaeon]|nr:dihydroorotate dehydrogenase [Candidatus Bathyarchaeota archaeon]